MKRPKTAVIAIYGPPQPNFAEVLEICAKSVIICRDLDGPISKIRPYLVAVLKSCDWVTGCPDKPKIRPFLPSFATFGPYTVISMMSLWCHEISNSSGLSLVPCEAGQAMICARACPLPNTIIRGGTKKRPKKLYLHF